MSVFTSVIPNSEAKKIKIIKKGSSGDRQCKSKKLENQADCSLKYKDFLKSNTIIGSENLEPSYKCSEMKSRISTITNAYVHMNVEFFNEKASNETDSFIYNNKRDEETAEKQPISAIPIPAGQLPLNHEKDGTKASNVSVLTTSVAQGSSSCEVTSFNNCFYKTVVGNFPSGQPLCYSQSPCQLNTDYTCDLGVPLTVIPQPALSDSGKLDSRKTDQSPEFVGYTICLDHQSTSTEVSPPLHSKRKSDYVSTSLNSVSNRSPSNRPRQTAVNSGYVASPCMAPIFFVPTGRENTHPNTHCGSFKY